METIVSTEDNGLNTNTTHEPLDPNVKTELLTSVDADFWIGRYVVIKSGKYTGLVGEIIRCGNGWVQVSDLNSNGEISKRAHELECIINKEDVPRKVIEDSISRAKKAEERTANSLRATSNRSPSKRGSGKKRLNKPESPTKSKTAQEPAEVLPPVIVDEATAIKLRHEACLATEVDHRDRMKQFITLSHKRHYAECRPNITEFFDESTEDEEEEEERRLTIGARDYNVLQRCNGCGIEMGSDWKFCWNPICDESPIFGAYDDITVKEADEAVQCLIAHETLSYQPSLGQLNSSNSKRRISQRELKPSGTHGSVLGKRGRNEVDNVDGLLIESHLEYRWRRDVIETKEKEAET
jgi:hypothetical protein